MANRKTIIIVDEAIVDGYVLTYSSIDGYFKPLPASGGIAPATVTDVSSPTYTVTAYDFNQRFRMLYNGSSCQVTLPAAASLTEGSTWTFKDVDGYAGTYTYSVVAGANTTIDKASSWTFPSAPYTALSLVYHSLSANWEVI
jgi:hypothetical protein